MCSSNNQILSISVLLLICEGEERKPLVLILPRDTNIPLYEYETLRSS